MSDDSSTSVLSTDQKSVTTEWQTFLTDPGVNCPMTPITDSNGNATGDFECTSTPFFGLKFSTAANSARFKSLGPYIDTDKDVVLLSLESTTTALTYSLTQVLTAFTGASSVADGTLISTILNSIIDAATGDVNLELDITETRNAVWCIPGQTPVVTTALVFHFGGDDGKLQTVKQKISDEFGISLPNTAPLQFFLQCTSTGVQVIRPAPGVIFDSSGNPVPDPSGKLPTVTEIASYSFSQAYAFTVKTSIDGMDFWLHLDDTGVSASITQTPPAAGVQPTDFWDKLKEFTGAGTPSSSASQPGGPAFSTTIDLLSISAGRYFGGDLWWQIQSVLEWDSSSTSGVSHPVLVGLSYDSRTSTFMARLLTQDSFQTDQRLPFFVLGSDAIPSKNQNAVTTLPDVLKLSDVFPDAASLPRAVPDAISAAEISYSNDGTTGSVLVFALSLTRSDDGTTDSVPSPFTWDQLAVTAKVTSPASGSTGSSELSCGISAAFTLNPRPADQSKYLPAAMAVSVLYAAKSWKVSASITNLQCGLLFGFFDSDEDTRNAVAEVIGNLTIVELDVLYTYNGKLASSFLLSGTITLGKLEMRLFYQYVSSAAPQNATAADQGRESGDPAAIPPPTGDALWAFECRLGAADGTTTNLGEIIDSIIPGGSNSIPDFATGISIAPASGDESAISIKVAKVTLPAPPDPTPPSSGAAGSNNLVATPSTTTDKTINAAVFVLDVNILGVKFSFIQISSNGTTRYLLRLAVDKIPLIGSIPLIDKLPQPFDEMEYLWVSGSSDLTEADVTAINQQVLDLDSTDALLFKANTQPDPQATAIVHGHHFVVINNGAVTLDHVFQPSSDEITQTADQSHVSSQVLVTTADSAPAPDNQPTKGALSKTIGPLTISAITLQYKDKVLWVHMDAVLALGPISLGLLDFGIGFDTTGLKLNNLSDIATDLVGAAPRLQWELHGLSLAFDQPPLVLAGMFEHDILAITGGTEDVYKGGIGVSFPPYTFVGVGEYANVIQNGSSYKSVFVFAKLDGPLVTLEFATISGVRLGFGFNSIVRTPSLTDITTFPFIQNSGSGAGGDDPMTIMQSMDPRWVTPKLDSYWFAAGMTITAFDVVAITAIALFGFRDSGVVISIVADAIATMPPNEPDSSNVVLYVEIGMIAELNFIDGYFLVEASLAPTSFLLVPQCHLTGGFALAYWFGDNANAGDWVFSIGGYHRAYTPPPYYPVPDRIGINFQIGDNIQMTGQSYFAVTPKVVMAGALIHVSLNVGPVSAYLDATFDALINFHPLHYIVEFSISVGVECDIDILFIHIHISVHIGAELHIEGPSFHGIAHVDFWFFGFDVSFGDDDPTPPPQTLLQFWQTTHQPGPNTSDRGDNDADPLVSSLTWNPTADVANSNGVLQTPLPAGAAFKFILQDGNMPQPMKQTGGTTTSTPPPVLSTGAGAGWFVKGGTFQFGITTEFALSAATVDGTTVAGHGPVSLPAAGDPAEAVYSRPMRVITPITSVLTIKVEHEVGSNWVTIGGWLDVAFITKLVPTALWSSYDPQLDLLRLDPSGPPPSTLLNGTASTIKRAMGVTLSAPPPVMAKALVPTFEATSAAEASVQQYDPVAKKLTDWFIPAFEPEQDSKYLAAKLTADEVKLTAEERWDAMISTWSALESEQSVLTDPADGMLMVAATEVFLWNVNRPQTETASTPTASTPTTTESQAKRFAAGGGNGSAVTVPAGGGGTVPAGGGIVPTGDGPVPAGGCTVPAGGGTVPAGGGTVPAGGGTVPTGGGTVPAGGGTVPAGGSTTPTTPTTQPPWMLTGQLPMNLINGLKDRYLALPRVCVT